jgi:hypothetical protein
MKKLIFLLFWTVGLFGQVVPIPNTITGAGLPAAINNNFAAVPQKYSGSGPPGSLSGNLPGDTYWDTLNHVYYSCSAPIGTPTPACVAVAVGGWSSIASSGGSAPSGLPNLVMATDPSGSSSDTSALRALVFRDLPAINTSQVAESGSLYFTAARAQTAMVGLYQSPITGAPGAWPSTFPPVNSGDWAGTWQTHAPGYFQTALANYSTISGLTGYPSTFPPTNSGDWAGTWQTHAPSYFQQALTNYSTISGLTGYPSTFPPTNSGDWAGTWQTYSPSHFQSALTLTTTGTSGAATLSGGTLNIPQYAGGSGILTQTTGSGAPTATCVAPTTSLLQAYYDSTNLNEWVCLAAGTGGAGWQKEITVTNSGEYIVTGLEGTAPSTPASTYQSCYFDSTSHTQICLNSSGVASTTVVGIANPSDSQFVSYIDTAGVAHRSTPAVGAHFPLATARACVDSSGSGTAQSCTTSPSFTPASGDEILYTPGTTNSGDVTINVNSTAAKHVRKWSQSTVLASGDLVANVPVALIYDGTYWEVPTIGNAPSGGSSGTIIGTSGIGAWYPFGRNFVASSAYNPGTGYGAWWQVTLPFSATFRKINFQIKTASGTSCTGGICGLLFGIFSADSTCSTTYATTTPIISGGSPDLNVSGVPISAIFTSPVTLAAGAYLIGVATDSSALVLQGGGEFLVLDNTDTTRQFRSATATVTGDGSSLAFPANCSGGGGITAHLGIWPVMMMVP